MPLDYNYREVPITINGHVMNIAGFKRPVGAAIFQDLKVSHGIGAVVSLDGNHKANFIAGGIENANDFYTSGPPVTVEDWFDAPYEEGHRIPPATYDAVYDSVVKAQEAGKKIAIHCGAGDGRTGTALASLKLRELLEEAYKTNPNNFDNPQPTTGHIHMHHGVVGHNGGEVDVTPFVRQAIELVRSQAIPGPHANSVESRNDVESLMVYEQHLRNQLVLKHTVAQAPVNPIVIARQQMNALRQHAQDAASSLSPEQMIEVREQINQLQKEINSKNPFSNKAIKAVKLEALNKLIEYSQTDSVQDAVERVKAEYPTATKGKFGSRTAEILNSFAEERPAMRH